MSGGRILRYVFANNTSVIITVVRSLNIFMEMTILRPRVPERSENIFLNFRDNPFSRLTFGSLGIDNSLMTEKEKSNGIFQSVCLH